jgi:Phosphoesterase family
VTLESVLVWISVSVGDSYFSRLTAGTRRSCHSKSPAFLRGPTNTFTHYSHTRTTHIHKHTHIHSFVMNNMLSGVLLACMLLAAASAQQTMYESGPIKHVVVLMYENRAFDHMLGYLHQVNSEIEGLNGTEYNYLDPYNPTEATKYTVNFNAPYVDPDLGHSVHATATQIQYGSTPMNVSAAPMNGFSAQAAGNHPDWGPQALSAFNTVCVPTAVVSASSSSSSSCLSLFVFLAFFLLVLVLVLVLLLLLTSKGVFALLLLLLLSSASSCYFFFWFCFLVCGGWMTRPSLV